MRRSKANGLALLHGNGWEAFLLRVKSILAQATSEQVDSDGAVFLGLPNADAAELWNEWRRMLKAIAYDRRLQPMAETCAPWFCRWIARGGGEDVEYLLHDVQVRRRERLGWGPPKTTQREIQVRGSRRDAERLAKRLSRDTGVVHVQIRSFDTGACWSRHTVYPKKPTPS